jgi:hypothetical protein
MLFFIEKGYTAPILMEANVSDAAGIANLVGDTWQDKLYLKVQQDAWDRLAAYYETIAK